MAKRGKMPFIAGKQYGDAPEPDADDMAGGPAATMPQLAPAAPPVGLASRKRSEAATKGPAARAPRGRGY